MKDDLFELALEIQHYLEDEDFMFETFGEFIRANITKASEKNKEFKQLNTNSQRACLSYAFESLADGYHDIGRHCGSIAESISYDYEQLEDMESAEPPYNPMTEIIDMFNLIPEENDDHYRNL